MLEEMIDSYEPAFVTEATEPAAETAKPESVRSTMKRAMARSWKHLARERIENITPQIPLGKRFWPLSGEERREMSRVSRATPCASW
jgi:hypothetical protein